MLLICCLISKARVRNDRNGKEKEKEVEARRLMMMQCFVFRCFFLFLVNHIQIKSKKINPSTLSIIPPRSIRYSMALSPSFIDYPPGRGMKTDKRME